MQDSDIKENFLNSMRGITSTVNVISATAEGNRHAMTATSVTSLSLDPPSMLVCVNKDASLHKILLNNSNFWRFSQRRADNRKLFHHSDWRP